MTDDLVTKIENGIGRITLNRPKALHALTTEMCAAMAEALTAWERDDAVRAVLIDHAEGTRGFCAGGDIRKVAESGRKDGVEAAEFFRVEYTLNNQIKHYPKPYIAIMDGITMGGGVGISVHGSHRIVTERTVFAMPETGIGLFPDVGGGWFLPRLEGELGTWLALTGAKLHGEDVVHARIGTHFVPSDRIDALKAALLASTADDDLNQIITKHSTFFYFVVRGSRDAIEPAPGELDEIIRRVTAEYISKHPGTVRTVEEDKTADHVRPSYSSHIEQINRCFALDTMTQISIALNQDGSEWALKQAEILAKRSPQSLAVALKQLREGRRMTSFEEVMKMEYRLACRITRTRDFSEGVRAVIEDKDNAPDWLAGVNISPLVEQMFDSLGQLDLKLP